MILKKIRSIVSLGIVLAVVLLHRIRMFYYENCGLDLKKNIYLFYKKSDHKINTYINKKSLIEILYACMNLCHKKDGILFLLLYK